MLRKILLTLMTLGICGTLQAQSVAVAGKWELQVATSFNTDLIVIDFKVEGNKLDGTISRSDPPGQLPVALTGEINGDMIVFTVQSPDGLRTITMTGKVSGDEINFSREATGTAGAGPGQGFYGLQGPAAVVATRVKH